MGSKVIEVMIFHEKYKIVSSYDDHDRIVRIAGLLDRKMSELSRQLPQYSPQRIAVLTSLNLLDEIFKLQLKQNRILEQAEKLNHFITYSQPDLFR